MTTAAHFDNSKAAADFAGAQMGDATIGAVAGNDVVGSKVTIGAPAGDQVNNYSGVPGEQILQLFARWLDKEPQRQALEVEERLQTQQSTDARFDRISQILNTVSGYLFWVAAALVGQALILFVLLVVMVGLLLVGVGPRLLAVVSLLAGV